MTDLLNIWPLPKSYVGFEFCDMLRRFAQVNSFYLERNVEKPHNIAGVPQSRVNERKSGIIRCCRIAHVTVLFLQSFLPWLSRSHACSVFSYWLLATRLLFHFIE